MAPLGPAGHQHGTLIRRVSVEPVHSVLFVCTANICRSPMAEGLLRDRITKRGDKLEDWRIGSAGINAQEGIPVSRFSEEVLKERGIDISLHRARQASGEKLADHNLILTMEPMHKSILRTRFPQFAERIFLLSEMTDQNFPVDDPFGMTLEDYRRTADVLARQIDSGMERIVEKSM